MKKMDKKAFTLIELIVVISIVGTLTLLGAPRFLGYTQRAELTRIQHDVNVMEQEIGTMLINNDDDFNKWENNDKDFNQLIQENRLFEKEDVANKVDSIDKTYKVIPEKYKDNINTKLKGTFYASSGGKVYYEHGKSLFGIPTEPEKEPEYSDEEIEPEKEPEYSDEETEPEKEPEYSDEEIKPEKEPEYSDEEIKPEKEPEYSDEEIDDLIKEGYIPIATAEELNNVRSETIETYGKGTQWERKYTGGLGKHYVQVANIGLSEYSEEGWNPIGTLDAIFTGTYDGGNYIITGLEVKGEGNRQGLFGRTVGATIHNVGLIDNKVTGSGYNVGGLVGYAYESTISNSYSTGKVTSLGTVGGLVGWADGNTKISNSYSTGEVTGSGSKVGGLVGYSGGSMIENSYATGTVTGEGDVGGLVGYDNSGTIENSYATGEVTATGSAGGLVGRIEASTVTNSYWDTVTTGRTWSVIGEGKITEEMKKQTTYEDWNFDEIWKIQEGVSYPTLINNPERH